VRGHAAVNQLITWQQSRLMTSISLSLKTTKRFWDSDHCASNLPSEYESSVDAEITGVYVHPSVTRNGVGTEILTNLEQEARGRDNRTLGLSASLNAVPFYEYHGYERVRAYTHEFSGSASTGVDGQIIEMKKEL
jgi:predicted GNAT family acetyltransferase